MTIDVFRPRHEPAQMIYDAFQKEARKRGGRTVEEWQAAERLVVWQTTRDYAQQHDLMIPTMEDIEHAEQYASGHIDYGAKWAYQLVEVIQGNKI